MNDGQLRILVAEDDDDHFALLLRRLARSLDQPEVTRASSLKEARSIADDQQMDLVFLDLGLPDSEPHETLTNGGALFHDLPVIVLTSAKSSELGTEAIKHGAQDYFSKEDASGAIIGRAVQHALERFRITKELERRNQTLEAFAHTLAHEFRSPLQPVVTTLGMISEKLADQLPPRLANLVELSQHSMAHLNKLIDELLEIAKNESDDIREPVDLDQIVREVTETLSFASEKKVEIYCS